MHAYRGAWLARADLSKADLVEASPIEADLNKADLWGADLSGTNLREARFEKDTTLPDGTKRSTRCCVYYPSRPKLVCQVRGKLDTVKISVSCRIDAEVASRSNPDSAWKARGISGEVVHMG